MFARMAYPVGNNAPKVRLFIDVTARLERPAHLISSCLGVRSETREEEMVDFLLPVRALQRHLFLKQHRSTTLCAIVRDNDHRGRESPFVGYVTPCKKTGRPIAQLLSSAYSDLQASSEESSVSLGSPESETQNRWNTTPSCPPKNLASLLDAVESDVPTCGPLHRPGLPRTFLRIGS